LRAILGEEEKSGNSYLTGGALESLAARLIVLGISRAGLDPFRVPPRGQYCRIQLLDLAGRGPALVARLSPRCQKLKLNCDFTSRAGEPIRWVPAVGGDRSPAWLEGFLDNFCNIDQFGVTGSVTRRIASFNVAVTMSAIAAYACISTRQADFRADLPKIDIPVMVIQGDADRILPFDKRQSSGLAFPAIACLYRCRGTVAV
jgi:pimeloyl-ACP methyl ester carboxylesterase